MEEGCAEYAPPAGSWHSVQTRSVDGWHVTCLCRAWKVHVGADLVMRERVKTRCKEIVETLCRVLVKRATRLYVRSFEHGAYDARRSV